jgi:hypothetical protein
MGALEDHPLPVTSSYKTETWDSKLARVITITKRLRKYRYHFKELSKCMGLPNKECTLLNRGLAKL